MPRSLERTPLVGRERELAALLGYAERAAAGRPGLVLVSGEPGVGKTRLLAELAERLRGQDWRVLFGRAYDTEGMPPFLPFVEALRSHLRDTPPDVLGAQLGADAADVAVLLPELRSLLLDLTGAPAPAPDRYRLFEAVSDLLIAATTATNGAHSHPGLLLVLDDLHWADTPSLLLLQHLARRLAGSEAPLLVAGTYRTVELGRTHPLAETLAVLARERLAERLPLEQLDGAAVATLIGASCGATPAAAVVEAVRQMTGGNAFFLEEVVRHLLAEGRDLTDARAAEEWSIPEGARRVIGARLARLDTETNRMLQAAAVLGDGRSFEVLRAAGSFDEERLLDAVEEALRAGVLREEAGGYHFSHALIRHAAMEELSVTRRQRLHLRAAEAIETVHARNLEPYLAALAGHYRLAGSAVDSAKAVRYFMRAGDSADARLAHEDAIAHRQAALELLEQKDGSPSVPDDAERCDLLLALADAQVRAGDPGAANATYRQAADLARQLKSPAHLARAAIGQCITGATPGAVNPVSVAVLEEALVAVGDGEEILLRARLLAQLAGALWWSPLPERRLALSRDAVALARRVGDAMTLAASLHAQIGVLSSTRQLEERLALSAELLRVAAAARSSEWAMRAHLVRIPDLLEQGETAAADVSLAESAELAVELRQPVSQAATVAWQAARALMDGRFLDAESLIERGQALQKRYGGGMASQSAPMGQPAGGMAVSLALGLQLQVLALHSYHGRPTEMDALARKLAERTPAPPLMRVLPAAVAGELGRSAEAQSAFDALAANDFASVLGGSYALPAVVLLAQVCATLGDRPRAARLYDRLTPYAGRVAVANAFCVCFGAVAHYLGLLATTLRRWSDATQHFEDALAMHERMGARPYLAHTQRAYAVMLLARRRSGDLPRARLLLEQAAAGYDSLAMVTDAAAARALLAGPRVATAPLAPPAYPDGLSTREVEVLGLIAGGKSNREIAEALVISPNTVERHINHIFAKIGVANRVEAATYAHRHALAG